MAEASTTTIVQLFNDWEIQLLILISFALQLFLFFTGGLRRGNTSMLLNFLIWLAYLSADSVALYALGYLSRHLPTYTTENEQSSQAISSQTHQLTLLWAPFLLVHLVGQDTVTAYALEDNELWLRHLLNLLVQTCLVFYVLWRSAAYDHLIVIPALFVFVAGFIKYGERIYALKLGSLKGIKSSPTIDVVVGSPEEEESANEPWPQDLSGEVTYPEIIKRAGMSVPGVRGLFAGRKIREMDVDTLDYFLIPKADAGVAFKLVEIELTMVYDDLFTKARVIRTRLCAILRCVSFTSTIVAFVTFITMSGEQTHKYNSVDAAITYTLFWGAFLLEACSVLVVMMSQRAWIILEYRGWRGLSRAVWCILVRIQPETRCWWSNSMGQYNFLSCRLPDKRLGMFATVIAKMIGAFGANELWSKMRNTRRANVTMEMKKLISQATDVAIYPDPLDMRASAGYQSLFLIPFEKLLLSLHVWTDLLLHEAGKVVETTEEMRRLMDSCKGISDYMMYLLVMHPAMLPVGSGLQSLWATSSASLTGAYTKEDFFQGSTDRGLDVFLGTYSFWWEAENFWDESRLLLQQGFPTALQILEKVWARVLVYAAGKSKPEEHARQLSTGGELLTLVWLRMAHGNAGDVGNKVPFLLKDQDSDDRAFLFSFPSAQQVAD